MEIKFLILRESREIIHGIFLYWRGIVRMYEEKKLTGLEKNWIINRGYYGCFLACKER